MQGRRNARNNIGIPLFSTKNVIFSGFWSLSETSWGNLDVALILDQFMLRMHLSVLAIRLKIN